MGKEIEKAPQGLDGQDATVQMESKPKGEEAASAGLNPNSTLPKTSGLGDPRQGQELGNGAAPDLNNLGGIPPMDGVVLRQHEDEHLWRKQYLQKSFYLVATVLYFSFFIVMLVGVGLIDLTDKVLMTILATTVAHVVGVLAIAFHWLYPHSGGVGK